MGDSDKVRALMEAINTYSPTGKEDEMGRFLSSFLLDEGMEARRDDAGNVVAIRGSGDPVLWLHAHMDTVPGFAEARLEGGKIMGRGASDDKAPLMAMVYAFLEAAVSKGTLVLTAVVQEEGDSAGTEFLIRDNSLSRPSMIIVGEPTGVGHVVAKYRGSVRITVKVSTKGGHASNPDFESNAILAAMNAYGKISAALSSGPRYEDFLVTPTIIEGGEAGNAIPSKCALTMDVRIPPGKSCTDVIMVADELRSSGVDVEVGKCTEPIEVDVGNPAARAVTRAITLALSRRPILARKWGTSDMNELAALTRNMIAYGPGDGRSSHSTEEYVYVDDYLKSIVVYKRAVEELLS